MIRGSGFIVVGVALLEEVFHWGEGFGVSKAQARLSIALFRPMDLDVEL